jgi:hypothetical protein
MRASAPLRNVPSGEPIRARARLENARIEERYRYHQEISLNAAGGMSTEPEGNIKLVLPYDGDRYFTRQAHRDVIRGRHVSAVPATDALVGFLGLTGYENTNLDGLLNLRDTYGSVPIRVRLHPPPHPRDADLLVADSSACVISHDYQPGTRQLKVTPVLVDMHLDDPDTAEFSSAVVAADPGAAGLHIMRHVSFTPDLSLRMTVLLHVSRAMADGAHVEVSQVFMSWPTHTSLRSLVLRIGGQEHPLRYNPERESHEGRKGGLEWSDVPMTPEPDPIGGEIRTFRSPEMDLSIPQPGDFYRETSSDGLVEVTIDRLLSGMDARLYDATGKLSGHQEPEVKSVISTEFSLILDDAFARRTLTPYQQLHFDEVIPSEMRIDDIITALRNRGFAVANPPSGLNPESCWVFAERVHGPDTLRLDLYIKGQRYKTRRQRDVPGGASYRTEMDSGELRIYVYGALPRNSQPVVQEMNALRLALHERFDRLPARRLRERVIPWPLPSSSGPPAFAATSAARWPYPRSATTAGGQAARHTSVPRPAGRRCWLARRAVDPAWRRSGPVTAMTAPMSVSAAGSMSVLRAPPWWRPASSLPG